MSLGQINQLSGRSSFAYARLAQYSAIPMFGFAIIAPLSYAITRSSSASISPVAIVAFSLFAASFLALIVFAIATGFRSRSEVNAGYTTAWKAHRELPQINPRTGEIVRAANEPFLDIETLKARTKTRN